MKLLKKKYSQIDFLLNVADVFSISVNSNLKFVYFDASISVSQDYGM